MEVVIKLSFDNSIILNSPKIRLKSLETFLTSSWRSPCCFSYSPSKFLRIWTGPHSGCRLPCDLPAHLLRRHRCHLLPRAQGRLDQLQVLIRTKNSASLILWMLQLHVLIRTAKSTFITFLWMLATATNSHSHKQTSLSITHSWFCLFESAASPYSDNKTQVLILTKIILLNQIHTNMSSHTSLQACQVWIRHKSTFIYQQNKINIIQELLKKSCEKFPTLLLKHLKRMFIVGPHSQRQQWSTLRVTEALTG